MRRILTLVSILAFSSLLGLAACGSGDGDDDPDGLFVLANFQLTGTGGVGNCTLQNPATDAWINDATVTINGETIAFVGEGVYQNLQLTGPFAPGDTVTITIDTPDYSATAQATIPATGTTSVDVDGALEGSVFNVSSDQ